MMRNKRALCAVAACMVALSMGFAEEGTAAPTAEVASPTAAPTEAPTVEPTVEPTAEPTAAPTEAPTAAPTTEPTTEPTADPTTEPTSEPTAEPTTAPTAEPTPTPAQFEIVPEGNAQRTENVWRIALNSAEDTLHFRWTAAEGATVYAVQITDADGNIFYAAQETAADAAVPANALQMNIAYTLAVSAFADDAPIIAGEISFIPVSEAEKPDDVPDGGGFPSGGGSSGGGRFPSGSAQGGDDAQADMGFHVTAGEALTSRHASGTGDAQAYGTLKIVLSDAAEKALSLDGTELSVTLNDGESGFCAAQDGDKLILTPETDGDAWHINALALKTLRRSGISALRLRINDAEIEISTKWQPCGAIYADLSAAGYVSKDYELTVTASEQNVTVAGQTYKFNENNELVGG